MIKLVMTVEEYLANFQGEVLSKMQEIRSVILETVPEAIEGISYGMPAYKFKGKPLAYFAGYKKHVGYYPTPHPIGKFPEELNDYKTSKGAVQFPLDKPVPKELIVKMLRARIDEI